MSNDAASALNDGFNRVATAMTRCPFAACSSCVANQGGSETAAFAPAIG